MINLSKSNLIIRKRLRCKYVFDNYILMQFPSNFKITFLQKILNFISFSNCNCSLIVMKILKQRLKFASNKVQKWMQTFFISSKYSLHEARQFITFWLL